MHQRECCWGAGKGLNNKGGMFPLSDWVKSLLQVRHELGKLPPHCSTSDSTLCRPCPPVLACSPCRPLMLQRQASHAPHCQCPDLVLQSNLTPAAPTPGLPHTVLPTSPVLSHSPISPLLLQPRASHAQCYPHPPPAASAPGLPRTALPPPTRCCSSPRPPVKWEQLPCAASQGCWEK